MSAWLCHQPLTRIAMSTWESLVGLQVSEDRDSRLASECRVSASDDRVWRQVSLYRDSRSPQAQPFQRRLCSRKTHNLQRRFCKLSRRPAQPQQPPQPQSLQAKRRFCKLSRCLAQPQQPPQPRSLQAQRRFCNNLSRCLAQPQQPPQPRSLQAQPFQRRLCSRKAHRKATSLQLRLCKLSQCLAQPQQPALRLRQQPALRLRQHLRPSLVLRRRF